LKEREDRKDRRGRDREMDDLPDPITCLEVEKEGERLIHEEGERARTSPPAPPLRSCMFSTWTESVVRV
jgi:hypothetical protein